MNSAMPSPLFTPLTLGAFELMHRLVLSVGPALASSEPGSSPFPLLGDYYRQRVASGGLVICGACIDGRSPTAITPHLLPRTTFLVNEWRKVTDVIRTAGGLSVLQLTHPDALLARPMGIEDIDEALDEYRTLADNASDAGFDGVEVTCPPTLCTPVSPRGYPADSAASLQFFVDALLSVTSIWPAPKVGLCCTSMSMPAASPLDVLDPVLRQGLAFLRLTPEDPTQVATTSSEHRAVLSSYGTGLLSCGPWMEMEASAAVANGEVDGVAPDAFATQADLITAWSSPF